MKEFATVRELEKKSVRLFEYVGGALLGGFVLMFIAPVIGIPLMIISALGIVAGIVWISMLGKESSRAMFCPYCSSKNDVFQSRRNFDCDICGRPVIVSESGEPLMAQNIDTEARYDR